MKFNATQVANQKANFKDGDRPTGANFAALIQAIADGLQEHDHKAAGGAGSGTGDAGIPLSGIPAEIQLCLFAQTSPYTPQAIIWTKISEARLRVNPSYFPGTVTFVLEIMGASQTALLDLRLYNLTLNQVVAGSDIALQVYPAEIVRSTGFSLPSGTHDYCLEFKRNQYATNHALYAARLIVTFS